MENRPILPKPSNSTDDHGQAGPATGKFILPKKKKAPSRSSCDTCRARKSGCDGQRPICSTCRLKGTRCSYKSRDKLVADESNTELVAKLKSLPEDESIQLLRRLRAGQPPDTLSSRSSSSHWSSSSPHSGNLSHGQVTESSSAPSQLRPEPNLAPKATGIELELLTRFPIAYPTLLPVDLGTSMPDLGKLPDKDKIREQPYCDDCLRQIDIEKWTDVPIGSQMAGKIISFYLTIDHPMLGLFDADLFLRDLVSGDNNFCSPMLVNAVLGWASQAYGVVDPEVAKHKDAFFEEAVKRFENTKHRNTLTAVATSYLVSFHATCRGDHDAASRFLSEAIAMGRRMGLYGATEESSAKNWLDNHQDWIRAASHTAWGAYCAATLHSLRHQTPLVEAPPLLPIPSKVGSDLGRTRGDRYESYPTPGYMGQTFHRLCELLMIAHKILWTYYSGDEGPNKPHRLQPGSRVTVKFAEQVFRELLDWSSSLPLELVRADDSPHRTILLHLYFHCLVMDILRPFCQQPESGQLSSFEASEGKGDIDAVYRASVDQLKRLVLVYLTKFEASSYCFLFQTSLLYLFNALVREVKMHGTKTQEDEEWKFYLRLCMEGMSRLFPAFDVIELFLKGMLCLAVRAKALDFQTASSILDDMRHQETPQERNTTKEERHKVKAFHDNQDLRGGSFIVDLDLATVDPDAATLGALTAQFDDLTMQSGHQHQADQQQAEEKDQQRSASSGRRQVSNGTAREGHGAADDKGKDTADAHWED